MSCCTDWPTEDSPGLHDLYTRKLLVPGWAGEGWRPTTWGNVAINLEGHLVGIPCQWDYPAFDTFSQHVLADHPTTEAGPWARLWLAAVRQRLETLAGEVH